MALGGAVGTVLTVPANTVMAIWIDSNDVRRAVLSDSIDITMGGPGTNSSARFTIDDPLVAYSLTAGTTVRIELTTAGVVFAGTLDTFRYHTEFGNQGRQIFVTAVGNEAILDALVVASDIVFSGVAYLVPAAIARIMANLTSGTGPLRWNNGGASANTGGDYTYPVGLGGVSLDPAVAFTIAAGSTLRSALQALSDAVSAATGGLGLAGGFEFTIDPMFGLRVFRRITDSDAFASSDLVAWLINPSHATNKPADMNHVTDSTGLIRAVYVTGTGGATAFATDGSGILGITAFVTVPSSNTTYLGAFAADYLNQRRGGKRGDVRLDSRTDVTYGAAIGRVDLGVNTSMGISAANIDRYFLTYSVDLDNFTDTGVFDARFHYGGKAPSGAALIRTLTRSVAS